MREETKEKRREYSRRYYYGHKERMREQHRKWLSENRGKQQEYNKNWSWVGTHWRLKVEVLTYYGGGKLACVRCGESHLACLSIDHINNDGSKDRMSSGKKRSSSALYYHLKKQDFPKGYQTLCMNCQFIKKAERSGGYLAFINKEA